MADFSTALQIVLVNEGGYVNDPNDPGGETYKGVARKIWSKWDGWALIDQLRTQPGFPSNLDKDQSLQGKISDFYEVNFWNAVNGDKITNQEVATSIFDFAVNAGVSVSAGLAQTVVGAKSDGVIGDNTIAAINAFDPKHFISAFTVAKIARYIAIVKSKPASSKFFFGWVQRAVAMV